MQYHVFIAFLLAATAPSFAIASDALDSRVIAACLDAVHAEARRQTPARGDALHVLPSGPEAGSSWIPATRAGGDAAWLGEAFLDLNDRLRQARGWTPPRKIPLPGVKVRVKGLDARRRGYEQPLHFVVWPPGYDVSRTHALVLATFGPADHGAEAACELGLRAGRWEVLRSKAVSFL